MVYHLYVSVSGEDKISIFTVDAVSGRLEAVGDAAVTGRPAPMAASPDRRFLYVGSLVPCDRSHVVLLNHAAMLEVIPDHRDRRCVLCLSGLYQVLVPK